MNRFVKIKARIRFLDPISFFFMSKLVLELALYCGLDEKLIQL